jgi:ornithine decarboxylase antizyme 1
VGELRNPSDPANHGLYTEDTQVNNISDDEGSCTASNPPSPTASPTLRLKFKPSAAAKGNLNIGLPAWDAVLWRGRLYVSVSAEQLHEGSKDAFVSLLEYAEEELKCSHVVVCVDKNIEGIKAVIRNFLFLGFQPLAPGHEFHPPSSNANLVSFVYTI